MFDASIPPLGQLLDGAIPAVAIVIGGAVVGVIKKRRETKREDDRSLADRLGLVEKKVDAINDGMFGVETRFGWQPGFVEKTEKALAHLVGESKANGGSSTKDQITRIERLVTPKDGDDAPEP